MQRVEKTYKILLDQLISVSFHDKYIGPIDKRLSHTNEYILSSNSLPHRAFSIFLFNNKNELFLQRRSAQKVTFPLCWSNTVCSHPNIIEFEDGAKGEEPIRDSLHRALDRQLRMDLKAEKFHFVQKILYKQAGYGSQKYGQFEVDYIYLIKLGTENVKHTIVPQQISETEWVKRKDLNEYIARKRKQNCVFTPWFMKINENGLLNRWWELVEKDDLKDFEGENSQFALNLINK